MCLQYDTQTTDRYKTSAALRVIVPCPNLGDSPTPRQNISIGLGHTNPRLLHAEGRSSFLLVHGCASLTREEEVSHIHLLSLLWKPVGDRYARRGALECAYVVQCVAGAYVCLFAVSWQARASLGV